MIAYGALAIAFGVTMGSMIRDMVAKREPVKDLLSPLVVMLVGTIYSVYLFLMAWNGAS